MPTFMLRDYINLALSAPKGYMLWILVTSGAEGKVPSLGLDYGAGKSTFGLNLLKTEVYAGNWEKVKKNCIGAYWEIEDVLDRGGALGVYIDDLQATLGKDKSNVPEIKELAYYLTTVRPYVKVWIASAPDRNMICSSFRMLFHFEVVIAKRGKYEVQQLKKFLDFKKAERRKKYTYKGEGYFLPLPPDIQQWYDEWRDQKNRMIRAQLQAFKGIKRLHLERLTAPEKDLLALVQTEGFVRYETLHDRDQSHIALKLRRRGWLEMDRGKRFMLSEQAEDILFGEN